MNRSRDTLWIHVTDGGAGIGIDRRAAVNRDHWRGAMPGFSKTDICCPGGDAARAADDVLIAKRLLRALLGTNTHFHASVLSAAFGRRIGRDRLAFAHTHDIDQRGVYALGDDEVAYRSGATQ